MLPQKRARQASKRSDQRFRADEQEANSAARSAKRCDPDCRDRDRKANAAAQQARRSDPIKQRRENEKRREQRKRIKLAMDKVRIETPLSLSEGRDPIAKALGNVRLHLDLNVSIVEKELRRDTTRKVQ